MNERANRQLIGISAALLSIGVAAGGCGGGGSEQQYGFTGEPEHSGGTVEAVITDGDAEVDLVIRCFMGRIYGSSLSLKRGITGPLNDHCEDGQISADEWETVESIVEANILPQFD